jgi:NAD(P)-dependent dehydrogenase (short-subunit alcohol dehydrogenase family)
MGRLEGQVSWISGAASGIGEGVARLFAAEGARVVLIDLQGERGQRVCDEIRAAGGDAEFIRCDVGSENDVRQSMDQTVKRFGALHSIVNSAGIVHITPLHEYSEQEWDRLMAINVKSIFFSVKHGFAHLRKNPRSYVVNIGSISSFVGQANTPAYTTSKGAVLQLSRSIALDYAADGVRCNCICPGITDTPMLREHMGDQALAERLKRVPMGVALTPNDIAKAALYFACEDSSGITGTSLTIDAGYLAAAEWTFSGKQP